MSDKMLVKECIKKVRYQLCMSQKDFAEFVGVHKGAISLYELGHRQPGFDTIKRIVDKLKQKGIAIEYADLRDK